jgi:cation:H+ antiporter
VSLGTTLPEAFISVMAAFLGNPGLALGNGVGSIIADTGLIFGLSAILTVIPANKYILNRTGWWQLGSAVMLVVLALTAALIAPEAPILTRWMGLFLLALLITYLAMTYMWAKKGDPSFQDEITQIPDEDQLKPGYIIWPMILGGMVMVISGSRVMIPAASQVALRLGVPQDVIAATMVAFGTSLPELTTAITALRKGHPEITVGNIVGADVLNALFVIGAAATASPLVIPSNFFIFHFPVMLLILVSFRVFIAMAKHHGDRFRRWQGAWLLGIYILYVVLQYTLQVQLPG